MQEKFTIRELEKLRQNVKGRPIQIMVACGPFTVNNELSYDGLKDLMAQVAKEQPNVLILTGPFTNIINSDVQNGDIRYRDL